MGVDFKDPGLGGVKDLCLELLDGGQIKVALCVHGRHGHHKHVRLLVRHDPRHLVHVEGQIADVAAGVVGPRLGIVEDAVDEKGVVISGIGVEGVDLLGDAAPDRYVPDAGRDGVQRPVQQHRLADIGGADDGIAAVDEGQRLLHGAPFFLIELVRCHKKPSISVLL